MTLEEALPEYDFREVHSILIAAELTRVLDAVKGVTLGEMPAAWLLLVVRSLPALVRDRRRPWTSRESVLEVLEREGFVPLGGKPGREVAYGVVGRFWKLAGNMPVLIASADDFKEFGEPGHAKIALSFHLQPEGAGTRLTTETRIAATDDSARRSFRRYWRVIRPGSGLIRILWLRSIKRRAER